MHSAWYYVGIFPGDSGTPKSCSAIAMPPPHKSHMSGEDKAEASKLTPSLALVELATDRTSQPWCLLYPVPTSHHQNVSTQKELLLLVKSKYSGVLAFTCFPPLNCWRPDSHCSSSGTCQRPSSSACKDELFPSPLPFRTFHPSLHRALIQECLGFPSHSSWQ